VLDARLVLELLVGRRVDGEQHHAVEPEARQSLLRAHHVSHVGRVERPAQQADPAQGRTWPSPSTRYLIVHSSRSPIGPRAWSFWVELPISAPIPNSPPSVKRVEALT
jgi:hypothetical protein